MIFKNLQLPDFIIADMYKKDLVAYEGEKKSEKKEIKAPVNKKWYLGENKKNVLIALNDGEAVFLRDEWLQFLSAILQACKLNLADVAIINLANQELTYKKVSEELKPQFYILFDINLKNFQLPFIVPNYQIQQYNQAKFLLAVSLLEINNSTQEAKLEKSRLWLSLKKMFNIQ
jgi:hypothetical protein